MSDWQIRSGAIVERPRTVREYPLLAEVYDRHDSLIDRHAGGGRMLEVAFGTHPHPNADVAVEAYPGNTREVEGAAVAAADARDLPFEDGTFDAVVGRRFLHHVPSADRGRIVEEARRVLDPEGRLVILEGTPGAYRRLTKGLAFRLGLLGEDNDAYGHLSRLELGRLLAEHGFDVVETRPLGSPLLPLALLRSPRTARLAGLYERTQWITWWTLAVGEPRADERTPARRTRAPNASEVTGGIAT